LSQLKYNLKKEAVKKKYSSTFFPLYRLPAFPILPVNSIFFTILPVNLKPGKSSTLISTFYNIRLKRLKEKEHNIFSAQKTTAFTLNHTF
jgi:hypothetical protein